MRVIRSPIGSVIDMLRPSSPARLHEAGDHSLGTLLAQRDAAHLELAVEPARTAGHFAAVADARGRAVARQRGELEGGGETLLHRLRLVHRDRLEARALAGELLRHLAPPIVLLDRTRLRHSAHLALSAFEAALTLPHCRNGKLNAVSSARASSSVRAVVQTVMSMPQTSAVLS